MNEIIIDEEFKGLLPPLDEETFSWLENNILEYGCREPLVVWGDILIDGHNRYEILKRYELPINTVSMEFDSRDDVIIWIISTQVARRNLTPMQLSYYRGLHYNTDKRVVTNINGRNQYNSEVDAQNEQQPKEQATAKRLSEKYRVSPVTIRRDAQVANAIDAIGEISPDIKRDILSGKTQISRTRLQELATGSSDDVAETVLQIEEGTFENRRTGAASNSDKSSDSSAREDVSPWEKQFNLMTDEFRLLMRGHAKADDKAAMKTALRQYISMLEGLYGNM